MEFVRSLFRPFCTDEDDVEVRSMTAYRPQYQCPFGCGSTQSPLSISVLVSWVS
jgi:hypothetical protein